MNDAKLWAEAERDVIRLCIVYGQYEGESRDRIKAIIFEMQKDKESWNELIRKRYADLVGVMNKKIH